jgi:GNAT superfamily N-acetyltransferase
MPIDLRPMTRDDIPLGMRLKELAGWNQTPADWAMLLAAGSGLVAMLEGAAVGTATVVGYGKEFSWVGMVLVDPVFRRCGIGTALLEAAIALGRRYGGVRLDATPQGEPLYRRLGFEVEYGLVRMWRPGVPVPAETASDACIGGLHRLAAEAILETAAWDAPVFGARRALILKSLQRDAPGYAFHAGQHNQVTGYCLGRSGSDADQIGPIVAEDLQTAQALLIAALSNSGSRDVIVDVSPVSLDWMSFLKDLGFVQRRPFTRMCLGGVRGFGKPEKEFAIAGPEIG